MGHKARYTDLTKQKEVFPMKTIKALVAARKPLSFQTAQTLYGVSILLTFLAVGRLGMAI